MTFNTQYTTRRYSLLNNGMTLKYGLALTENGKIQHIAYDGIDYSRV